MSDINIDFHPELTVTERRSLIKHHRKTTQEKGVLIERIVIQKEGCISLDYPVDNRTLQLADCVAIKTASNGIN